MAASHADDVGAIADASDPQRTEDSEQSSVALRSSSRCRALGSDHAVLRSQVSVLLR